MPEEVTFEYEYCPLRSRAHRLARIMPPIRPLAGMVWPAARRADRIQLTQDGLLARSLSGYVRIGWDEVGAVHRARTITLAAYRVLPDLELFNLKAQAANDLPVPHNAATLAALYGLAYSAVFLLLAIAIFSRRDLK